MASLKQCWVIKNEQGYYVNANFGAMFTGIATGFIFYDADKKETMQKDLERLGEGYYCEQVNLNEVPDGKRVYI